MNKHVIVVSIDAMVTEDLEYASTLPNFARILDGASLLTNVRTIYPTLTHPIHATLLTGAAAGTTTIINNLFVDPKNPMENSDKWFNDLGEVACDTILHAAKRRGLTTASASFPMTCHPGDLIDYHFPNALDFYFKGREDDPLSVYRDLGASECLIDLIGEGIEKFGFKDVHPNVDEFQIFMTCEIIKRYKPNLLLSHPGYVDNTRHKTGVFGKSVNASLEATDRWLGEILDAIDSAKIADTTDVILLSDHGQIGIVRTVSPNVMLVKEGFITLDTSGNILSHRAYVKSAGGSAHVYLADPEDKKTEKELSDILCRMADEGVWGFEKVYTVTEVKEKYALDGSFSFVLETDGYTAFSDSLTGDYSNSFDKENYSEGRGKHGHAPEKGPQPLLIAKGPSFKSDVTVNRASILGHAPTVAAILGLELLDAECAPHTEIIR